MKVSVPATISKGVIQIHPAYAGKAAVAFSRLKVGETVTVERPLLEAHSPGLRGMDRLRGLPRAS